MQTYYVLGQPVTGITGITVKPTGGKIVSYIDDVRYYPELTYIINTTRKNKLFESGNRVITNGKLKSTTVTFKSHEMTNCSLNIGRLFYNSHPILKLTYEEINLLLESVTIERGKIKDPLTILKVNGKWRVYRSDHYGVEEAVEKPYNKNSIPKYTYFTGTGLTFFPTITSNGDQE